MSSVDERIVRMQFDNAQFEAATRVTMQTLEKLKSALKLDKAGQAFDNVTKAASEVDLAALQNGVDVVAGRFSNLGIIGMTALQNITNAAINAGSQMIKSLTIDPINQGFGEYELKMGSVQTIMASTGADLDTVNGYLEQLNTYADKTIYSFSDMTNSIGKFTNAGVDLDTAVKAIQGISNEAAVSGANANEASRAMYNFAQALSAGSVKLIDWKSIENANMATKEFKQELIDTAVSLGTLVEAEGGYISTTTNAQGKTSDLFNATSKFNDNLAFQWMTTDVLTTTLARYADETTDLGKKAFAAAQDVKTFSQMMDTLKEAVGSGWSQTFELIFGDFEEAKELWTGVANAIGGVIDKTSSARNELLKTWKTIGGRDAMIKGFANIWTGLLSVLKPIKEAFSDIFGSIQPRVLKNLSRGFAVFTKQLIVSGKTARNIKDTFKVLFSILKVPVSILKTLAKLIAPILSLLMKVGSVILSITGFISRLVMGVTEGISKFIEFIDIGGKIQGIAKILGAAFDGVRTAVSKAFGAIKNISFVKSLLNVMTRVSSTIRTIFNLLGQNISSALSGAFSKAGGIATKVASKLTGWFGKLIDKFKELDSAKKIFGSITSIFQKAGGKLVKLRTLLALSGDNFEKVLAKVSKRITDIWTKFKEIPIVKTGLDAIQTAFGKIVGFAMDKFAAALDWIVNLDFEKMAADVSELFKKFRESEEVQTLLEALDDAFDDLKQKIKDAYEQAKRFVDVFKTGAKGKWDAIVQFLKDFALATKDVHSASDLWDLIKEKWKELVKAISNFKPVQNFVKILKDLRDAANKTKQKTGDGISNFLKKIGDAVKKIDFVKVAKGLRNAALAIRLLVGSFNAFRLNNKIVGILGQVKKMISSYQHDVNSNALLKIAIAIGILSASIIAIAWNAEKIRAAGDVLAIIALSILGFVAAFDFIRSKLGGDAEVSDASEALGEVITKLTGVLKKAVKAAAFAARAVGIYFLAKALSTIISALKELGDFDPNPVLKNIKGISLVFGALLSLAFMSRLAGTGGALFGVGILALAIGVKLLISDIMEIAKMNMTKEQAQKVAGVLAGVGIYVVALAGLVNLVFGKKWGGASLQSMLGFAGMMIGVAYAIKMIVGVMDDIAKLSWGQIMKAGAVLGGLGGIIAVLMLTSKNAAGVKAGPIIALAVVIGAVAVSLWVLSGIEWTKLAASALAMGGVLVALGFVAMQLKEIKAGPAIVGALSLALLLGAVVGAFWLLDYLEVDGVLEKAEGISLVLGTCAIVIALLGQLPITAGLTAAANLAEFLGVLAGALAIMGDFAMYASGGTGDLTALDKGIEIVKKVGEAIGGFIGGIAAGAIEEVTSVGDSMKKFAESMDYFMFVFEKHDGQAVATSAKGLADALTALIGANFLNNLASFFGGENGQLDDFGTKLKTFGESLVTYADTVSQLKTDAIDNSVKAAEQLTALSDQVHNGGVIGFWAGDSDLDTFGRNLVTFGNSLVTFSSKTSELNTEKFQEIAEATEPLVTLTDKVHNGGVIGWWTGNSDLDDFGQNLVTFGSGLVSFATSIAEIDTSKFEAIVSAVDPLIDLTTKIENGGVIGWWVGNSDLDDFGANLEDFGSSLADYSENVSGDAFDIEAIKSSAEAASALADVALAVKEIPTGSTTIGNFAGSLASFGSQLKNYGDNISGLSDSIVKDSLLAKNAMVHIVAVAIACKDASDGGAFEGTSLGSFGDMLPSFGEAISTYSTHLAGMDQNVVQNSNKAAVVLRVLAHAAEEIPDTSGLAAFFGSTDLETFSGGISTFGESMVTYSTNIAGMDENVVANTKNAADALKTIANAANDIPNSGGLAAIFAGDNDVETFGSQLENFGGAMKTFTDTLANVNYDNIDKTVKAVNDLSAMAETAAGVDTYSMTGFAMAMAQMAADGLSGFTDNFATGAAKIRVQVKSFITAITNIINQGDLGPSGKKLINSLVNGVRDNLSTVKTMGATVVSNFSQGVVSAAPGANSAGASLANNVAAGARSANSGNNSFYQIGRNFGEGLRLGIKSKEPDVRQAGYDLGAKAVEGAKAAPKVKSPSRVAIQIGEYIGEGLVIGMNSYANNVERAGYTLGSTAATSIDQMVQAVMDAANADYNPVITPVLDLSQIQNGGNVINGMLSAQTVSFNAANAQISALSTSLNQASLEAAQNQAIVDEIGKLRNDITVMGNRMRNLQVVMDSGELVGSITDKVDRSLGIKYA